MIFAAASICAADRLRPILRRGLDLRGGQAAADDGEDVARPALPSGPFLVVLVRNRLETNLDAQFRRLEQEILHHLSGILLVDSEKDAQRQRGVDVGLADVQYLRVVAGEDFHKGGGESDPVLAGDADEYLFVCHSNHKSTHFCGIIATFVFE